LAAVVVILAHPVKSNGIEANNKTKPTIAASKVWKSGLCICSGFGFEVRLGTFSASTTLNS
jgi:hypothetical protein